MQRATGSPTEGGVKWEWERREMNGGGKRGGEGGRDGKWGEKNGKWGKKRRGRIKGSHPTRMGFEPTRAEHNGLAVHRLNHSATSSAVFAPRRVTP